MKIHEGESKHSKAIIAKWFKLAVRARATDAYWDPKDEWIKTLVS